MRRTISLFIALATLFCGMTISAKDNNQVTIPEYEIKGNGTGAQGTYLVSVSVYHKDRDDGAEFLGRCAIHGVLFRGFSNKELRQAQKPLAGSASVEIQHKDFFYSFFAAGGRASNYTTEISGSRRIIKSGKLYKITAIISVNKDQLRKDLEDAGIIQKLGSAF